MGTPHKNIRNSYVSPYSQNMMQYPSQSESYISSEFGGRRISSSTPSKKDYKDKYLRMNFNQGRRQNDRYFNIDRNSGNSNGKGNGFSAGRSNSVQTNNSTHQTNRPNKYNRQTGFRDGSKYAQSEGKCGANAYYHPSMLEDPWKELLKRYNAISNSKISVPRIEEEKDECHEESEGQDQTNADDKSDERINLLSNIDESII